MLTELFYEGDVYTSDMNHALYTQLLRLHVDVSVQI